MRVLTLCLLALLVAPATALADGAFFVPEGVPPNLPYQRALLHHDAGVETLVLQSKYEFTDDPTDFGWVVPLPAVPEVGVLPPEYDLHLFSDLDFVTQPHFVRVLLILALAGGAAAFVVCLVVVVRRESVVLAVCLYAACVLGWAVLAILSAVQGEGAARVEVVVESTVGPYEVKVVRSDEGASVLAWLEANGFRTSERRRSAIDDHAKRGWCFVATRIRPGKEAEAAAEAGLTVPLILRFPAERPVYPLALTGAGGTETEVLLYVAAPHRMGCGERLGTRYAGRLKRRLSGFTETRPAGLLPWTGDDGLWITKLKGLLSPEEMREDLVLSPVEDVFFRGTRIVW